MMQNNLVLMRHWIKMLTGKSYYHVPQNLGKAFRANQLCGYFNDMTAKTNWKGILDKDGVPMVQLIDGSICYFATTIIQKALGHYDRYILIGGNNELAEFIKICNWLITNQDEKGGWDVHNIMSLKDPLRYSAMPQGEAISALVRAWKLTGKDVYIDAATKAYELMTSSIENGGTAYYKNGVEIFLEEYPSIDRNTVLNGWIFALFGIYDYFLVTGKKSQFRFFCNSFNTLRDNLYVYDAGFWSYYDGQKTLASTFYHDLHISQLEALFIVTGDKTIKHYIDRWKGYKRNLFKKCYAFILKANQKLKNPASVIIVR